MKNKSKRTPTKEQRDAADPTRSVWVAASAGSGKTQVLVDRVIRLLLDGAAPAAILCLTFTKAAAAEMSNRLFSRLSEWIGISDEMLNDELKRLGLPDIDHKTRNAARRLFALALETPGGLKIQTIHAFCERLLQLFPVESGMAPGFRVMDEHDTKDLFGKALLESLTAEDPLTTSAWEFLDDGSVANLEMLELLIAPFLSGSNGMRRRFSSMEDLKNALAELPRIIGVSPDATVDEVTAQLCDIDVAKYKLAVVGLMPLEADASHCAPKFLQKALNEVGNANRSEALTKLVLTGEGEIRKSILRKAARNAEPTLAEWLDGERQRILELLETRAKLQLLEANLSIYKAMASVMARVNLEKKARGLYDFDDLITRTAQLLEGHEAAQWVLYKLDKGLTHILVDEAQDTSPAQWNIIKALAGEFFTGQGEMGIKRTVFAVGDIKQSIYSFQGADISAFEAARKSFSAILAEAQDPLSEVGLSISYRSNQQILDVVDQVFAPGRQARRGFGPRADFENPHTAHASDRLGLVELWDLVLPDDKEEEENWRAPVDRKSNQHPRLKLAERIAGTIKSWIGRRQLSGQDRVVAAGDVLILLQSRNDLFQALLGALRRHGVPVAGADRLNLQDSMIVQDLLMLGQFIRMPSDDHALACLLKSPLVPEPIGEEQLFDLAHDRGALTLMERLPTDSANFAWLEGMLSSRETPYQRFARVLRESRRHILERLGQEAEDASQEFINLALDYEQKHGTSLIGFLDWVSSGETQIKREMEANTGLVRLMTVHGSKGLEAPIVILADAADPPPSKTNRLLVVTEQGPWRGLVLFEPKTLMVPTVVTRLKSDKKIENLDERSRLLYVGMTRAADELYICGSLNKQDAAKVNVDAWYQHVKLAIAGSVILTGLKNVVMEDGFGLTRFGADPVFGPSTLIKETVQVELPDWVTAPLAPTVTRHLPPVPSRNSDAFDKKAVEEGIATHKLIEMMANVPPEARLQEGRRWATRLKLNEALAEHLHDVLQHPDLAMFFITEAQSEVTIGGANGLMGRIDRMLVTDECIYLLDYKTNRNPPKFISADHQYAKQMADYASLLKQAFPGRAVKAALLWTQTGAVMWLNDTQLSQPLEQQAQASA